VQLIAKWQRAIESWDLNVSDAGGY